MSLIIEEKDLEKFIMVGDRVLVKPKNPSGKTKSGLYLPPSVQENEKVQSGYIVKVGPGYPIPAMHEDEEAWKDKKDEVKSYHFKGHFILLRQCGSSASDSKYCTIKIIGFCPTRGVSFRDFGRG